MLRGMKPSAGLIEFNILDSASGPARSTATNSALPGQFPAGQCQRFINGLGNNAWFGVRLLAAVSTGRLKGVFVVVGHSLFLQFGLEFATREAVSLPETSREEAAARSLLSALTGSN